MIWLILRLRFVTDFIDDSESTAVILFYDRLSSFKPWREMSAKEASTIQFLLRSSLAREWQSLRQGGIWTILFFSNRTSFSLAFFLNSIFTISLILLATSKILCKDYSYSILLGRTSILFWDRPKTSSFLRLPMVSGTMLIPFKYAWIYLRLASFVITLGNYIILFLLNRITSSDCKPSNSAGNSTMLFSAMLRNFSGRLHKEAGN